MPSKFAGDIIAGGFAKGIGQGTAIRQSFAQKLGSQMGQRQRDLSDQKKQEYRDRTYRIFLRKMQEDKQVFDEAANLKKHEQDVYRLRERYRLIGLHDDTISENAKKANLLNIKDQINLQTFRRDTVDKQIRLFDNKITALNSQLKALGELGDETQIATIQTEILKTSVQRRRFISEFAGEFYKGAKTIIDDSIRREKEENKINRTTKKAQVDPFGIGTQ